MSKIMNNTNVKISKENREDEEGGIAVLRRLTKLSILPKFGRLDIQVKIERYLAPAVIFEMGSVMKTKLISFDSWGGYKLASSLVVGCLLLVVVTPLISSAAVNIIPCGKSVSPDTPVSQTRPCTFNDLVSLGQGVTDFLLKDVAFPLAVILFMWAGFLLMFKSSSAGALDEAKGIFWNVVIGFVVALAAVLIVKFILFSLSAKTELYKNRLSFNMIELKK